MPARLFNIRCRHTKLQLRQILHRRLRLGRDYDPRPRYLHRWNQLTSEQFEWDGFDLGEVAPGFLFGGIPRIIAVQIREPEAGADVLRGTHLSEGLSHIEPEDVSFQYQQRPTGLQQYGVSTYMAKRELAYTVKRS